MSEKIKHGTVRADGYAFQGYSTDGYEQWCSPKAYQRLRIRGALKNAKKRAASTGAPVEVDVDYLSAIFPVDGRCPVLGVALVWGDRDGTQNSPSLDKLVPERGYVRGNVCWISNRANTLKSNATHAEIERVLNYMKAFS